ncbi:MAG: ABC transporter permease [Verrucomicrobiota bacterium]
MKILAIAAVAFVEVIRRKEAYVLLILLAGILMAVVSLDIFGLGGVARYTKDIALLAAWVFSSILAVNVASRQIPDEEQKETVLQVLSKPVKRIELLLGKLIGSWIVVSVATCSFYLFAVLLVKLKGADFDVGTLTQGYLLHCIALAVICSTGLLFSTRLNKDAGATLTYALTAASFIVVPRIPEFVAQETGLRSSLLFFLYNVLPHFEVLDMRKRIVHSYGPVSTEILVQSVFYGIALTGAILILAWLCYRSKKFSRSNVL